MRKALAIGSIFAFIGGGAVIASGVSIPSVYSPAAAEGGAALDTLFWEDFESYSVGSTLPATGDGVEGGGSWGNDHRSGNGTADDSGQGVIRVSDTYAYSGSNSLEFGWAALTDILEQDGAFGENVTEWWLNLKVLYAAGTETNRIRWTHGPDQPSSNNNKFLRVWGSDGGDDYASNTAKVGASTWRTGTANSTIAADWNQSGGGMGPKGGFFAWTDTATAAGDLGVWIDTKVHVKLSTSDSSNDGEYQLCRDDVLLTNSSTLDIHTSANNPRYHNQFYVQGAFNDPPVVTGSDTTSVWVDDVLFVKSDPGWACMS